MPDIGLSHLSADHVLGFGISVLTVLMTIGLAVWFACSVAENVTKMGRRTRRPSYDALSRQNERLRDSLVDARQENDYLRKLYRNDLPPRAEDGGQNPACPRGPVPVRRSGPSAFIIP